MSQEHEALPNPEDRARRVAKLLREQSASLADMEQRMATQRVELVAARQLAADTLARVLSAEADRDAAINQMVGLAAAAEELAGLKTTRLLRWSAGPRRAYHRVRVLLRLSR